MKAVSYVIPAHAGIQGNLLLFQMDPRLRGDDNNLFQQTDRGRMRSITIDDQFLFLVPFVPYVLFFCG